MILLWTRSSAPLSVLIRLVTGEDCSHFSFVFEGPNRKGLMFESNLLGTHPAFLKSTLKSHTIIHSMDVPLSSADEDKIWDLCVDKYDGKPYDFGGALYLGWRKLLCRIFKLAVPQQNKWASPGAYFCDEVYDVLNNISAFPKIDVTSGLDTPHDVFVKLKGTT
jgi:hypothetical protein